MLYRTRGRRSAGVWVCVSGGWEGGAIARSVHATVPAHPITVSLSLRHVCGCVSLCMCMHGGTVPSACCAAALFCLCLAVWLSMRLCHHYGCCPRVGKHRSGSNADTLCGPGAACEGLARFLSRTGCAPRPGTAHFVCLIVVACRRRCVHARFSAAQAQLVLCLWHMPPAPCTETRNSLTATLVAAHRAVAVSCVVWCWFALAITARPSVVQGASEAA